MVVTMVMSLDGDFTWWSLTTVNMLEDNVTDWLFLVGNSSWKDVVGSNTSSWTSDENSTLLPLNEDSYLETRLGFRYRSIGESIILTVVYSLVLFTGVVGNVATCVVIIRNSYMHTATNCYLFSLAVSDTLSLVLGQYYAKDNQHTHA